MDKATVGIKIDQTNLLETLALIAQIEAAALRAKAAVASLGAVQAQELVGNSGPELELIAGEVRPMKECEVLWQVVATAIKEAQSSGGHAEGMAVEAASAFKSGLAAFNAATKEVFE